MRILPDNVTYVRQKRGGAKPKTEPAACTETPVKGHFVKKKNKNTQNTETNETSRQAVTLTGQENKTTPLRIHVLTR